LARLRVEWCPVESLRLLPCQASPRSWPQFSNNERRMRKNLAGLIVMFSFGIVPCIANAQAHPEVDACRATGLIALQAKNPAITDLSLDLDGLTVASANLKIEDTSVRTIVMGDVYLERDKKDTHRTMLCLIGEKGKVLLTFFTEK
jgi:hypothetical protein